MYILYLIWKILSKYIKNINIIPNVTHTLEIVNYAVLNCLIYKILKL